MVKGVMGPLYRCGGACIVTRNRPLPWCNDHSRGSGLLPGNRKLPRVSTGWYITSVFAVVASSALGRDSVLQELLVEDALSAFHKEKYF